MTNQIARDITANIRNNIYLLICDEYTDLSNKEQLLFFIRGRLNGELR